MQTCPSCLTDLTLFDVGGQPAPESGEVRAAEGKSIDDILASIMDGKSEQPEIFETLKSVAKDHRSTKDLVVEASPVPPTTAPAPTAQIAPGPMVADETHLQCPVCDSPVGPDDRVCPGCGAEFSEGQATEYECPVCKAAVPADANHCPSCGVRFEEAEAEPEEPAEPEVPEAAEPAPPILDAPRAASAPVAAAPPAQRIRFDMGSRLAALRDEVRAAREEFPFGDRKLMARELPRLVTEVKPLLLSAKQIGVGIDDGKRLINSAVEAGKRKEMEKAVKLISDARRSLNLAFVDYLGRQIEALAAEVEAAGPGEAATLVRPQIEDAFRKLSDRDYEGSWKSLQSARSTFKSQAKEYTEGRKVLEATERLLADVRTLGMDAKDVDRLIRQSRDAAAKPDLPGSLKLARQAQDRLKQLVPEFVQSEMKKARDRLLDLKIRGGDVSRHTGFLKEASVHVKNEEWGEAIRFLREFHKELSRASPKT